MSQGAFWGPPRPRGAILPSATCQWGTPLWLFERLHREFNFTVDAAASHDLHVLPRYWTREDDGLAQDWTRERVYCNPPYDHEALHEFAEKAYTYSQYWHTTAVLLVPVKSDQAWWHLYATAAEVRFIRGRLRYRGAENAAAFASAVLVFERWRRPQMLSMEQR